MGYFVKNAQYYMYIFYVCLCSYRGSSMHHFDDSVGGSSDSRIPFFTADITLAIPNVVCVQNCL